tara:strand:- start:3463 stop:3627 length:165 start_codon:yes stop_codon:yes gene_type:complete
MRKVSYFVTLAAVARTPSALNAHAPQFLLASGSVQTVASMTTFARLAVLKHVGH